MSRGITATADDPAKPGAEDWRPTSTANLEAKERDSFLAGWDPDGKGKPTAANDDAPDDDEDLDDEPDEDDDIDEEEDEEEEVVEKKPAKKPKKSEPVVEKEEEPDDDSDLDEEDEDEKPAADPAVARGMQKLQKQEKRMREQLDRERSTWQAEQAKQQEALQAEKTAAAEARSALERLKARVKADPASVLEELGVDDWDYTAKQTFTRSKAGSDPANREAAARLQAERELKSKLSDVEKKLADREKTEAEERKSAAERAKVDTYLTNAVKSAATVKAATLTQKLAASDPGYARIRFAEAAARLYQGGEYPDVRAVVKEVEKAERATLRRYGINPRTLAASPTTAADGTAKAAKKGKAKRADDDELKMPSREDLLAEDWSG